MNKKIILIGLILVAMVFILLIFFRADKKHENLNLLIITLDTTRADHIGAYGYDNIDTPNIDRICRKGVMFENCFAPVPLTLPSHCSIFTGKYSIGHNVRNNGRYFLSKDETTMAKLLKQKGFHTYAVVAAFVLLSKFGLNQGFDIYDDSLDTHMMKRDFKSEIGADQVYKKFKKWFAVNHKKRFFSWIHFFDPHQPYRPPDEYIPKGWEKDPLKLYDGEIEFVDKYVGKIIEDLKTAGILNKTLVIIVGDHGEAFGEHQEHGHSIFCYNENLKVPLVFFNEDIFENSLIKSRVNLVDIMPTILDFLGMAVPGDVQGKSFLTMLQGEEEKEERTFYVESMYGKEEMNWAPLTGIIDGNYKYISIPEPELYDLGNDKSERDNIFRKKINVARKYDKKLKDIILKYSDVGEKSKRKLSDEDIKHLKSLGYISPFSASGGSLIDPKKGVVVDNKLKKLSVDIKKGENLPGVKKELEKILIETPELKTPVVYILFYNVYKEEKDLTSALNILAKGIEEYPDFIEFRFTLASLLYDLKRYDKVIQICSFILEKNPVHTQAYVLLGDCFDQRNDPAEMIKNYQAAVNLEPENIYLMIKYSELLLKHKKFEEAFKIYDSLLAKDVIANNHRFLFKVAMLHAQYGTMVKAENILNRVVQINPGGKYHYYYAIVLSKNGKLGEAIRNMETALEKYPQDLDEIQKSQALSALRAWKLKNY